WPTMIVPGTLAEKVYGSGRASVNERHRHRYEFNSKYRDVLTQHGLVISGTSPDKNLVELIEIKYETDNMDFVPNQARKTNFEYAMSNSFGFGGTNGALLFRRWSE
ncbi:MAG: hypothetical protein ACLQEI_07935, partial [Terriglobales bacterium]